MSSEMLPAFSETCNVERQQNLSRGMENQNELVKVSTNI